MSHTADYHRIGLLPLRHHDQTTRIFTRTVLYGAAVSKREKPSGRYLFETGTVGDLNCALHFGKAFRDIPGWAFAWPIVVSDTVKANKGATTGNFSSVVQYEEGPGNYTFHGEAPSGARTIRDGGNTTARYQAPDFSYLPVLGGAYYPFDWTFASRVQKGRELPTSWPGFPKGYYGTAMAGSSWSDERPVVLSGDPRLICVNKAGAPEMSTTVVDLDNSSRIDDARHAPLHSAWRVVYRPTGGVSWGPRNPLAWNLGGGGRDGTAGLGLIYDAVGSSSAKGATTTKDSNSKPDRSVESVTQSISEILLTPESRPNGRPSGGGKGGGKGGASQVGLAATSHRAYGPLFVGSESDKHEFGKTGDGEPIQSAHLHTDTYFTTFGNAHKDDYDAPLEFQQKRYPNPGPLPYFSRVHLVMDHAKNHPAVQGNARGMWRWYAEYTMYTPPRTNKPNTPPPPTTPPTGEPPPTTPGDPPPVITPGDPPGVFPSPRTASARIDPAGPFSGIPRTSTAAAIAQDGAASLMPWTTRLMAGAALQDERGTRVATESPYPPMGDHFIPRAEIPVGAAAARVRESHERPQAFVRAPSEHAFNALLFIPQSLLAADADLRRHPHHSRLDTRSSERAPVVLRAEPWGGQRAGEWEQTTVPFQGKYARTGPGGLLFTAPQVDLSDGPRTYAPKATTLSRGYVAVDPNVKWATALPDTRTGGMKTGHRWGHDGAGYSIFEHLDGSGAATTVLGMKADKTLEFRESGGTLLNLAGLTDGQFLKRSGATITSSVVSVIPTRLVLSGIISPAQITANTDNYNPTGLSTANVMRVSTDASRNLTGIVAQAAGSAILLFNVGSNDLVLQHDVTSTAANRFYCPGSVDFTLNANDAVWIWYDSASSRWRVVES